MKRLVEAMRAVDEPHGVRLRLRNDLGAFPRRHGLDLGTHGGHLVLREEGGEHQVSVVFEFVALGVGERGHNLDLDPGPSRPCRRTHR